MSSNQKSLTSSFKQQVMKAWQPVPTINSTIILFAILSIFFLVMGIVLIQYSDQVQEVQQRYDVLCQQNQSCVVTIGIENSMQAPVYLYYQLNNFYQNHRNYVKSKSPQQLSGQNLAVSALSDCDPVITNSQMGVNRSYTGATLNPDAAAIPCGLIAKSIFNDSYQLYQVSQRQYLTINTNDIAWPSDRNGRYKNVPNSENLQWIDMEHNEHFMVWMRTAALPDFRKLWGRIETTLSPGTYVFNIENNFNVTPFDGQKSIVLSTTNAFGGKNQFLSIAYIVVGVICSIITIGFIVRKYISQEYKNK